MFITGVSLLIGLKNAFNFFFQAARLKVRTPWPTLVAVVLALQYPLLTPPSPQPFPNLPTCLLLRYQGSAFFFTGVILVLLKFAVIGMLIESVGLFFLFSGFIPKIILFMRSVPVVSAIFYLPFVDSIAQKMSGATLPV